MSVSAYVEHVTGAHLDRQEFSEIGAQCVEYSQFRLPCPDSENSTSVTFAVTSRWPGTSVASHGGMALVCTSGTALSTQL